METKSDYDGAWKEALERYLEPFLRWCFPGVAEDIDWRQPTEFLDKELQEVVRGAEVGPQQADKLVKVRRRSGGEEWVLIHVEVQSQPDRDLPWRMYQYHHRIADRFRRRVASLAVLADDQVGWRPGAYDEVLWGCRVRFEYPVCKLLDFDDAALDASENPIAVVIAAHRAAQKTGGDARGRKAAKWRLFRQLYERGWERDEVLELVRLIDWLMVLPASLALEFRKELAEYEEEMCMPFVTSFEQIGREEGLRRGLQEGRQEGRQEGALAEAREAIAEVLEARFGSVPHEIRERLGSIGDLTKLRTLLRRASVVETLETFRAEPGVGGQ